MTCGLGRTATNSIFDLTVCTRDQGYQSVSPPRAEIVIEGIGEGATEVSPTLMERLRLMGGTEASQSSDTWFGGAKDSYSVLVGR